MTTTRKLLQTNAYSQGVRVGDSNAEYTRTAYFDWRSYVSGMSMREILQKQSRSADSSDKEWLSDVWKHISNVHIYLVRRGYYKSRQRASGLLDPVFSRSESLQSTIIHSSVMAYIRERLQPTATENKTQNSTCPKMNDSGYALFNKDWGPSFTDNTYWSSRLNLQALPSLTYTLGKESFRAEKNPNSQ